MYAYLMIPHSKYVSVLTGCPQYGHCQWAMNSFGICCEGMFG